MIVRDARRQEHDLGPTPAHRHGIPGGSIARPTPQRRPAPSNDPAYKRAWRAARQADPEWVAKERERERLRERARRVPSVMCRNGLHEMLAGNLVIDSQGYRTCRQCRIDTERRRHERKSADPVWMAHRREMERARGLRRRAA